jgi:hypothetical protein
MHVAISLSRVNMVKWHELIQTHVRLITSLRAEEINANGAEMKKDPDADPLGNREGKQAGLCCLALFICFHINFRLM